MDIPLSRPDITAADRRAVLDVLKTPFLSLGPTGPKFEKEFAEYLGVRYAIAVSSGTCGLHLCIRALGIGRGDEVVTTPYSFIASANCVMFEGARPRFVDIDPRSWNIDSSRIASAVNSRTKALLPVHVFGLPCDMDEILHAAKKRHMPVIEDACEALGAEYRGKMAGTMGTCAVFGFYPNKQMTTGEGGMVVTNDSRLAEKVASMRNQGRAAKSPSQNPSVGPRPSERMSGKERRRGISADRYAEEERRSMAALQPAEAKRGFGMGSKAAWLSHERLGYNYRMDDMSAALGLSQLRRLDEILKVRDKVARTYNRILAGIAGIELLPEFPNRTRSWFVYVVRAADRNSRDRMAEHLISRGIRCGKYFPAIHLQPFYRKEFGFKRGDFPVCEEISDTTLALPFFNRLGAAEMERVAEALRG